MNRKIILLIVILSVAGGILMLEGCQRGVEKESVACTEEAKLCPDGSAVGRTGPNCSFAPCPPVKVPEVPIETPDKTAQFGKPIIMRVNSTVVFSDGLSLMLKEINDSRCPKGVQCIWQGELSPLFVSTANGTSDEIRLGTVRQVDVSLKGHTFSLVGANENNATILVSLESNIR
jgi:hypothetical protein